jgi:hypothetical protein
MVHEGKQNPLSDSIKAGNFLTSGVPINLQYGPFTMTLRDNENSEHRVSF